MSTLAKGVLEKIAKKLTEKSNQHYQSLKKEYSEIVTEIAESQVPEEVMKFFKKHSEYVETCSTVFMDGHGLNRESVGLSRQIPATSSYSVSLKLNAVSAEKIIKAKRKKEKAKDDYEQLLNETEGALFALKTHKNISENLPAAIPFLPPPMSNALVVNFDSLKKRLNKQPEIKTEVAVK